MSHDQGPRVSIGLPVYNGGQHLESALTALLQQSFRDFEIVIADNHSTDETEAICRAFGGRDARIRYVRNERNLGASWNFNLVFDLSRGRYFKWASANDVHAPEYLARCVEVLDRWPDVVLCYPKTRILNDRGEWLRDYDDNLDLPWSDPVVRFRAYLERVRLCNAVFGLTRPEVLRRTSRIGNYPGSDVVLLGELSLYGKFHEVPEYLFHRRMERQNFLRNQSVENWQEFFDPRTRGKIFMRTWRHQLAYCGATLRAPISRLEKLRTLALLGRVCVIHRGAMARELAGAVRSLTVRGSARN